MDNKLIFENYLLILKSTVEVYVHGTIESSNEIVRNILKTNLVETLTNQSKTYDLMAANGWYKTNNINNNEIVKSLNKLESNS